MKHTYGMIPVPSDIMPVLSLPTWELVHFYTTWYVWAFTSSKVLASCQALPCPEQTTKINSQSRLTGHQNLVCQPYKPQNHDFHHTIQTIVKPLQEGWWWHPHRRHSCSNHPDRLYTSCDQALQAHLCDQAWKTHIPWIRLGSKVLKMSQKLCFIE